MVRRNASTHIWQKQSTYLASYFFRDVCISLSGLPYPYLSKQSQCARAFAKNKITWNGGRGGNNGDGGDDDDWLIEVWEPFSEAGITN